VALRGKCLVRAAQFSRWASKDKVFTMTGELVVIRTSDVVSKLFYKKFVGGL